MAYWRLYYHFVWATKERLPLIDTRVEPVLYGYIIGKAYALESVIHAIGGIEDHVHVVASTPPKLSLSNFVKGVKGSSAYHINHTILADEKTFGWQRGYGVFSLGGKQLAQAIAYVQNQREHHRANSLNLYLETIDHDDDGPAAWNHGEAIAGVEPLKP